jgi:DNA-directed RNA polymerase specialized sigma24 family protein
MPAVLRALMAAGRSRELGEDAFQDAVAAALAPGALARIERADARLYAVGLRAMRRARWRQRLEAPLSLLRGSTPGPSTDPIELSELLGRLAVRQREVVIARFYLDLPYKDNARDLGISIGTARATVSQALARLRQSKDGGTKWTNTSS